MKKQIVMTLILLVAVVLFYSCEKEQFEAPVTDSQKMDGVEQNATVAIEGAKIDGIDTIALDPSAEVESRGSRQLIHQEVITLHQGYWALRGLYKHQMNHNYRYIAVVTPYHGDPDLYIHGRQPGSHGAYREIRNSRNSGSYTEEAYAILSDLQSHEDRLYFNIYANTYTQCKIQIYREYVGTTNGCTSGCLAGKYYLKSFTGTYVEKLNTGNSIEWIATSHFHGGHSQKWTLVHAGNDTYYIESNSGGYMSLSACTYGANWCSIGCRTDGYYSKWRITRTNDGYYYIQLDSGDYLTDPNYIGGYVNVFNTNNGNLQKWQLVKY